MTNQDSTTLYTPLAGIASAVSAAQTTLTSACLQGDTITFVFPRYLEDTLTPFVANAYSEDGYTIYPLTLTSMNKGEAKIVTTNPGDTIPIGSRAVVLFTGM